MIDLFTDSIADKSKVSFHEERPKFHEMPDEQDRFERQESFDQDNDYPDDQDQDQPFRDEKFQDQKRFDEADDQYAEDSVFNEEQDRHDQEQLDFQPEQPKLTPKQRWHRAYNKIVMQLNVSTLRFPMIETDFNEIFLSKHVSFIVKYFGNLVYKKLSVSIV